MTNDRDLGMFQAHMEASERSLLQTAQIPANAGHTLHRGTPRENLIRNFLESHLSANVAIGTGEIIDATSKPREPRNQFDIVIYRRNYPKLDFHGVSGFFVESVIATVEVKSLLTEDELLNATRAAMNLKRLTPHYLRNATMGWLPPKPLSFVIAYDGPAKAETLHTWIARTRAQLGLQPDQWTHDTRLRTSGTALDGVSVLGVSADFLTNSPAFPDKAANQVRSFSASGSGTPLMLFFLALQQACSGAEAAEWSVGQYLQGQPIDGTFWAVNPS